MEELSPSTLLAVLAGSVGVMTVLARILEKLVDKLLEERRKKNGKTTDLKSIPVKTKSSTTDIALQSAKIETLVADLDETRKVAYDVKAAVNKDIPHALEKIDVKFGALLEQGKEGHRELQELRRAIDNNSAATKALHNFLATRSSG